MPDPAPLPDPRRPDREAVRAMFEAVAPRYDLLNRILSLGVDRRWRREAIRALELRPGDGFADICGGTGDLALEAERQVPGIRAVNVDLSGAMLARYRARARRRGSEAAALVGDAMRLPIAGGAARAAAVGFGIRNVPDRLAALGEIRRALAPGGRLVVLEFSLPPQFLVRAPYLIYLSALVPAIARLLSPSPDAYRYLAASIRAFPPPGEFAALLERAGFRSVVWRRLSLGVAVRYAAIKPV